jgi:hypothetical protein
MAAAACDCFEIKDAQLANLYPEHGAGTLSAPYGDKFGTKLPARVVTGHTTLKLYMLGYRVACAKPPVRY